MSTRTAVQKFLFTCYLGDVIPKQPPVALGSHDNDMYELSDGCAKFNRSTGNTYYSKMQLFVS